MPSIIDPSIDARLERRVGNTEGLARRIAELERRVNRYENGLYIPHFHGSGVGPLPVNTLPGPTSGTAITVGAPGVYLCRAEVTGYNSGVGWAYMGIHIDGSSELNNSEMYFNQTGIHAVIHSRWFTYSFTTAGTHYFYLRTINLTTDTNDRWSWVGFRVAALA